MFYRRFCTALNDFGVLIPAEDTISHHGAKIGQATNEYFTSIFKYNEEQFTTFQKVGSVAGVLDLIIDRLVFDFDGKLDSKPAPELAHADAIAMCNRLCGYGFDIKDIRIFFSGASGFHVEVHLNEDLTAPEFKAITRQMANGLETYDVKVVNPSRIFRCVGSVNFKTGLYKIPLTFEQLSETVPQIQKRAISFNPKREDFNWGNVSLPNKVRALKILKEDFKPKVKILDSNGTEWAKKPKWLTNCRFSLQSGNFGSGERNDALICLAATYKNQGFESAHTYRILKGVAEKQSELKSQDRFSDSEIWNNIIKIVYSDNWKNGQFSCKDKGSWLNLYCLSLGDHKCESKGIDGTVTTSQVLSLFKNYADNYEQNILYSGISNLDKKMKFMVGTSNGVLAPPGVGKTSLCLQILEHNSLNDVPCLFYSYDMFHSALYMRMLQRESGKDQDYLYDMFKRDPNAVQGIINGLDVKFKNVQFCFKAGQTIDELEQTIDDTEVKLGRKPKLVIVDYNELVQTDVSDPTASSATVAQRLRQIANEKGVCIITLLQPAKQYCSPGDEMTNFNSVKGSSAIVQSLTLLLGCSRPGFNPLNPSTDKYFNITCLKNRNGPLFTLDLSWEGLRGKIENLEQNEQAALNDLRAKKADQQKAEGGGWG